MEGQQAGCAQCSVNDKRPPLCRASLFPPHCVPILKALHTLREESSVESWSITEQDQIRSKGRPAPHTSPYSSAPRSRLVGVAAQCGTDAISRASATRRATSSTASTCASGGAGAAPQASPNKAQRSFQSERAHVSHPPLSCGRLCRAPKPLCRQPACRPLHLHACLSESAAASKRAQRAQRAQQAKRAHLIAHVLPRLGEEGRRDRAVVGDGNALGGCQGGSGEKGRN